MVGIYKITSPTGKVYIGQSRDILKRWAIHKQKYFLKSPFPLYKSFAKYSHSAHKFEVITELPPDIEKKYLDQLEIASIELFKSAGFNMLNAAKGGMGGHLGDDIRKKGADTMKKRRYRWKKPPGTSPGHPQSPELKAKLAVHNKKKKSQEHKDKIRLSKIGTIIPEEQRLKAIANRKPHTHSDESKNRIRQAIIHHWTKRRINAL